MQDITASLDAPPKINLTTVVGRYTHSYGSSEINNTGPHTMWKSRILLSTLTLFFLSASVDQGAHAQSPSVRTLNLRVTWPTSMGGNLGVDGVNFFGTQRLCVDGRNVGRVYLNEDWNYEIPRSARLLSLCTLDRQANSNVLRLNQGREPLSVRCMVQNGLAFPPTYTCQAVSVRTP